MNRRLFRNMIAQYKPVTVTSNDGNLEWSGGAKPCNLPSLKFFGDIKRDTGDFSYDNPSTLDYNYGKYKMFNSSGDELYNQWGPSLRRVGSYRDEWNFCTGKVKRQIKEIVFDGTGKNGEMIVETPTLKNGIYYVRHTLNEPLAKSGIEAIVSTHFKSIWVSGDGNIYAPNVNTVHIWHKSLSTVDEWNTWLNDYYEAGSPVRIWCAIAVPDEELYSGSILPNDGGRIELSNKSSTNHPLELTYITHS